MPAANLSEFSNGTNIPGDPLEEYFPGASLAYLVGINEYAFLPKLQSPHNDCLGLENVLTKKHGFRVNVLPDPGKQQLLDLLHKISTACKPDSRVIFYFAGHGVADGTDEYDRPKGFLLPADAQKGKYETYIEMNKVMDGLLSLPCRHLLIILDCCYAGAFRFAEKTRSLGAEVPKTLYREKFEYYAKEPTRQVITSAACDQKAVDALGNQKSADILGDRGKLNADQRSPFAESLIHTLQYGDADIAFGDTRPDGIITGSELGLYLSMEVSTRLTGDGIPFAKQQTPSVFRIGDLTKGEFIFIHSPDAILNLKSKTDRNPYKGLDDYSVTENSIFYGRQRVLDGWWEGKIFTKGLLTVVKAEDSPAENKLYRILVTGRSGSGKSSLVKAGVLATLPSEAVHIITPGSTPFTTHKVLLEKINTAGGPQYLMVDQYEELITVCSDAEERLQFETKLGVMASGKKAVVIVTLRSDMERRMVDSAFIGKSNSGVYSRFLVPPFSREEIKEVVQQPASQQMLEFRSNKNTDKADEEFINRIIDEAFANPDSLPLLSFALSRLYDKREGIFLLEDEYDNFGGISGILDNKFTEAYNGYAPKKETPIQPIPSMQELFRLLILRMISFDAGSMAKRRVYTSFSSNGKMMNELEFNRKDITENIQAIKDHLVKERLLKTASEKDEIKDPGKTDRVENVYFEPAHEALLGSSNLLSQWQLEKPASGIAFQNKVLLLRSLSTIAQTYYFEEDPKNKKGLLWKDDPRLAYVKKLSGINELWLNKTEEAFVTDSLKAKSRAKMIGRALIIVAFAFITVAAVIFLFKNKEIIAEKENAQNQLAGNLWENSLTSFAGNNFLKSFLLLGDAVFWNKDTVLNYRMQEQAGLFSSNISLSGTILLHQQIKSLSLSDDEQYLLLNEDSSAELRNANTMEQLLLVSGHIKKMELNRNGDKLYLFKDSVLECWDVPARKRINSYPAGAKSKVDWDIKNNLILVSKSLGIVLLDSNFKSTRLNATEDKSFLFAPQQKLVSVSGLSGNIVMTARDIRGGCLQPLKNWNISGVKKISRIKLSKTGRYITVAYSDIAHKNQVFIGDLLSGKVQQYSYAGVVQLKGHAVPYESINIIQFSPDEKRLIFDYTNQEQATRFVVELDKGKRVNLSGGENLEGYPENFTFIDFFPNAGQYKDLLLVNTDYSTAIYNLHSGKRGTLISSREYYDERTIINPVKNNMISINARGLVQVHDFKGNKLGMPLIIHDSLQLDQVRLSKNGDKLFVPSGRMVYIYYLDEKRDNYFITDTLKDVFFSRNGRYAFTVGMDGISRILDCDSRNWIPGSIDLKNMYANPLAPSEIKNALISPDGKNAMVHFKNDSIWLLNYQNGKIKPVGKKTTEYDGFPDLGKVEDYKSPCIFTDDGKLFLFREDNYVYGYDLVTNQPGWKCSIPAPYNETGILFRPDGKKFISLDSNLYIMELELVPGKIAKPVMKSPFTYYFPSFGAYIDSNQVMLGNIKQLGIYNIAKGTTATEFEKLHPANLLINQIFTSYDRKKLLAIYDSKKFSLVDINTGEINFEYDGSAPIDPYYTDYQFSLDDKNSRIALMLDSSLSFFDVKTGKRSAIPGIHSYTVKAVFRGYEYLFFDSGHLFVLGADIDLPPALFQQQVKAITGTRLNEFTKEPEAIPLDELDKLHKSYALEAASHYKHCRYKQFNTWKRMHPEVEK